MIPNPLKAGFLVFEMYRAKAVFIATPRALTVLSRYRRVFAN